MTTKTATLLAVLTLAFLSLALVAGPRPPAVAALQLPDDVTTGTTLFGVVTPRKMPEVLQGYNGGELKVLEVRGRWVLTDYVGRNKKDTWLNFDHVIAYRTKR